MSADGWNHNTHYYDLVLRAVPSNCGRALDVGCGEGLLVRRLAPLCREVVGIDVDRDSVFRANASAGQDARISFVEGDAMTYPFPKESFDFIAAIATLHHLPLKPALARFRDLLRPGGVLAIVGLYRLQTLEDYAMAAAAVPASWILRRLNGYVEVAAPLREPGEALSEIRRACHTLLPGCVFRRRLLFRYSAIWSKL